MNSLNNNLNIYRSYFHGFQDILESKSAKQTAAGIGKIISGFTLIIPIIFGLGYLITKSKLNNLEKLCNRVSKSLIEASSEQPSQRDLITFLSVRVLDLDPEKSTFDAAFKQLDSVSQKIFFDSMSDHKVLPNALERIPGDIRELNIGLGSNPSSEMIDEAITQLHKSRQLHTVSFDISQTTYLTKSVKNLFNIGIQIIRMETIFESANVNFDLNHDYVHMDGGSMPNNALPASRIIHGIVYHLIKDSQLAKINIYFKSKDGADSSLFINPNRLSKISEEDLKKSFLNNPLNNFTPLPNAKDIWIAYVGEKIYLSKD